MKRLFKSKYNKVFAGICGGLGEYFSFDPTLIRLIVTFVCIITGIIPILIAYIIAAFIIPENKQKLPSEIKYKKLFRSTKNRKIAGLCGGIGEFFKIDPVIIRLVFLALLIVTAFGPMIIAYFIGWIIVPDEPVKK